MGNACSSRKSKGNNEGKEKEAKGGVSKTDDIKFDKSSFIMQKDELFKDNYLIGQSMGSGTYGEVRKCKNARSQVVRAVKILRKERLDDFEV